MYKVLKNSLRQGDKLYLKSIDRFGRNKTQILEEWRQITKEIGADIIILDMPLLDTSKYKEVTGLEGLIADIVLQLLSYFAKLLVMKLDQLPTANCQDDYTVFKQMVTRRRTIVKDNTRLKNSLHAFLTDNYYDYKKFFANIECKMSLAFFEKYSSPSKLEEVTVDELNDVLKVASNNRQASSIVQTLYPSR